MRRNAKRQKFCLSRSHINPKQWRLACVLAISSLLQHFSYSVSALSYFSFQTQSPMLRFRLDRLGSTQKLARLASRLIREQNGVGR